MTAPLSSRKKPARRFRKQIPFFTFTAPSPWIMSVDIVHWQFRTTDALLLFVGKGRLNRLKLTGKLLNRRTRLLDMVILHLHFLLQFDLFLAQFILAGG